MWLANVVLFVVMVKFEFGLAFPHALPAIVPGRTGLGTDGDEVKAV